jgi:ubiquinone/menaquinone biosynthesis C-methylase UbiE
MVRLAARVRFAGPVLDAGCGTGEHALYVASLGLAVWGVDVAETALEVARKKAHDRGLQCTFALVDALHLERLGREFKTVLDCGLFHTFDGGERLRYAASLASVTAPEGTLHVLCFSDEGPDPGPHPISQEDLRTAFCAGKGWHVAEVEPERIKTRDPGNRGAPAWIATIQRVSTEDAAERVGG